MRNIKDIIPEVAIGCHDAIVTIELICSDAYSARVLCDDILSRVSSDRGMVLKLRGQTISEPEPSA